MARSSSVAACAEIFHGSFLAKKACGRAARVFRAFFLTQPFGPRAIDGAAGATRRAQPGSGSLPLLASLLGDRATPRRQPHLPRDRRGDRWSDRSASEAGLQPAPRANPLGRGLSRVARRECAAVLDVTPSSHIWLTLQRRRGDSAAAPRASRSPRAGASGATPRADDARGCAATFPRGRSGFRVTTGRARRADGGRDGGVQ